MQTIQSEWFFFLSLQFRIQNFASPGCITVLIVKYDSVYDSQPKCFSERILYMTYILFE